VVTAKGDGGALRCCIGLPRHKVEQRHIRLALAAAGEEKGGRGGGGRLRVGGIDSGDVRALASCRSAQLRQNLWQHGSARSAQ
jgi:hypothetical protein